MRQLLNDSIQFSGLHTYKATKYLLQCCFIHNRGVRIVRKFNPNLNLGQFAIDIQESRATFRFGFVSLWICGGILGGFGIWDSNHRRAILGLRIVDCDPWFDSDLNPWKNSVRICACEIQTGFYLNPICLVWILYSVTHR